MPFFWTAIRKSSNSFTRENPVIIQSPSRRSCPPNGNPEPDDAAATSRFVPDTLFHQFQYRKAVFALLLIFNRVQKEFNILIVGSGFIFCHHDLYLSHKRGCVHFRGTNNVLDLSLE